MPLPPAQPRSNQESEISRAQITAGLWEYHDLQLVHRETDTRLRRPWLMTHVVDDVTGHALVFSSELGGQASRDGVIATGASAVFFTVNRCEERLMVPPLQFDFEHAQQEMTGRIRTSCEESRRTDADELQIVLWMMQHCKWQARHQRIFPQDPAILAVLEKTGDTLESARQAAEAAGYQLTREDEFRIICPSR